MPQVIRPDASTTRTAPTSHGATPTVIGASTMHGCMDEANPVAAEYTECLAGSVGDALVVGLGNPSPTPANDFNHIIRVCGAKGSSGGASVGFMCELRQGYVNETESVDSTADLDEALDATETGVDVTDGTQFAANDVIRIDGEQMLVTAISVNTLTVTRGVQDTLGTTHSSGVSVFIQRRGLLIASFVCAGLPTTVDTYYRYRLTTVEAARITDYTALQLRFLSINNRGGAPRSARLHWAEVEVPSAGDAGEHLRLSPTETLRDRRGESIHQPSDKQPTGTTARGI